MIEICKLKESFKHNRMLDDGMAEKFVELMEHGLSIDAVIEIMTSKIDYHADAVIQREYEIKRLLKSKVIRRSPVACAMLGVKCIADYEYGYYSER